MQVEATLTTIQRALFLMELELFKELSSDELAAIAAEMVEMHFKAGETIFQEGDAEARMHIVIEGAVEHLDERRCCRETGYAGHAVRSLRGDGHSGFRDNSSDRADSRNRALSCRFHRGHIGQSRFCRRGHPSSRENCSELRPQNRGAREEGDLPGARLRKLRVGGETGKQTCC